MPRHVRNFWVIARIDGVRPFASGPRSKDGGFRIDIFQRDEGSASEQPLRVHGVCLDGKLAVSIECDGTELMRRETSR